MVIEDRHVADLLKHHRLAQAIGDVSWGECRRHLADRAEWEGWCVIVADRWGASAMTGSRCGWVDERLTLADRTGVCRHPERPDGGVVWDRDRNAATNRAHLADSQAGSSVDSQADSQNACAGGSAGGGPGLAVKRPSMQQEPDTKRGLSTCE